MAKQPGNLTDLTGAGQQEWDNSLASAHQQAISDSGTRHFLSQPDATMTQPPATVDWDGIPIRVQTCLKSRSKAMKLSDWTTGKGDLGRSLCHEEYMEWRVVRNPANKITRIEITTEVQEYWITLARHNPTKLLALVARFAGEQSVPVQDVYGTVNPNLPGVTPAQREQGFRSMMLPVNGPPRSPYNNGQKAICFLYQSVNALGAAVTLAAFAAFPLAAAVGTTGQTRPLTGAEAIALGKQQAVDCRNSDPTIVGALIGQAFNGKKIALDDPAGIYIMNVDAGRLRQPDNQTPVPPEWFNLQRGTPSADGKQRFQRLVFEVPSDLPFVVGDLIDSQTGENIEFGWQVAQLVKVGLYVQIGGNVAGDPDVVALKPIAKCAEQKNCEQFSKAFALMSPPPPSPILTADSADTIPTRIPQDFINE